MLVVVCATPSLRPFLAQLQSEWWPACGARDCSAEVICLVALCPRQWGPKSVMAEEMGDIANAADRKATVNR